MVTTKNVQGDEPRTTTLERQVQTLTAAVEHLTKQNHNMKEQLCQKKAGLNIQEEDQEGTSAKRRDQEGRKVETPQTNQNNRTQAVHPSQIWHHFT